MEFVKTLLAALGCCVLMLVGAALVLAALLSTFTHPGPDGTFSQYAPQTVWELLWLPGLMMVAGGWSGMAQLRSKRR